MTTRTNKALVLTALALASGVAMAGISNTKHNLTFNGPGPNRLDNTPTNTQEICVFCHTPHGSNTDASAPLWNKNIPDPSGYSVYSTANSSTIDGSTLTVGSVSAACLSCHDGTQAMDNMINQPGSGATNTNLTFNWDTSLGGTPNGIMGTTTIAMLGQDLTNDHPIGIEYCGGGLTGSGSTVNGTCSDSDFFVPSTRVINTQQVFYVNTAGGTDEREKTDIILYTRDFSGVGGDANAPSVECASCHDPHVESKDAATQVAFLRVSQAGSGVCLACHNK
ncbi:MAG: hypothetical protein KDF95_12830 [Rhodocyclaceae bacterium]|nr:hypothetical protein [Rhodocyclaceae bacterium]